MLLAAGSTGLDGLVNYGLAGVIVVSMVIPMALYILRDKDRQLKEKEVEITRQRAENADLRRVLDPIAPALTEVGRVMNLAIQIIGRSGPPS